MCYLYLAMPRANRLPQREVINIWAKKTWLMCYTGDTQRMPAYFGLDIFQIWLVIFRATCFHFPSIEILLQRLRITRAGQSVAIAKMLQTVTETFSWGDSSSVVRRVGCTDTWCQSEMLKSCWHEPTHIPHCLSSPVSHANTNPVCTHLLTTHRSSVPNPKEFSFIIIINNLKQLLCISTSITDVTWVYWLSAPPSSPSHTNTLSTPIPSPTTGNFSRGIHF